MYQVAFDQMQRSFPTTDNERFALSVYVWVVLEYVRCRTASNVNLDCLLVVLYELQTATCTVGSG
jgi:hypothetical protein